MTDRTVRVAQVGCGHWGRNLARNFAEIGCLGAVSDSDPDAARNHAGALGVPALSWHEILADRTIEAVALATPAELHAAMALEALSAGKHVYVEKPLALTPADGERVVAAAKSAGRTLMVGHLLQYHPHFLKLRELVGSGELGPLQYLYSNRLSLGKFRVEEDVLWSFAPHDLSMLLALVGEEPNRVNAKGVSFVTEGIADWAQCWLEFPSGIHAHVSTSWLHPFKEQRLVVIGEKAMAVFEDSEVSWDRKLALYRHSIDTSGPAPVPHKSEAVFVEVDKREPLREECLHFVEAVRNATTPRTDGDEGLRVLRVLDAARSSMNAGDPQ